MCLPRLCACVRRICVCVVARGCFALRQVMSDGVGGPWCCGAFARVSHCIVLSLVPTPRFVEFFALLGVDPEELRALRRSERSRYHTFRYDTRQLMEELTGSDSCDRHFVQRLRDYLNRCTLMYATARQAGHLTFDVAQFVLQCEALSSKEAALTDPLVTNPMNSYFEDMMTDQGGRRQRRKQPLLHTRSFTTRDFARVADHWRESESVVGVDDTRRSEDRVRDTEARLASIREEEAVSADHVRVSTAATTDTLTDAKAGASEPGRGPSAAAPSSSADAPRDGDAGRAKPSPPRAGGTPSEGPRLNGAPPEGRAGSERVALLARTIAKTTTTNQVFENTRFRRFQLALRRFYDGKLAVGYNSTVKLVRRSFAGLMCWGMRVSDIVS